MTEHQKIVEFLDDYLAKNNLDGVSAAEASRLLHEAELLEDDPQRPGDPLRKLLRAGAIPHARKEQGKWLIPKSPSTPVVVSGTGEGGTVPRLKILLRLLYSILFLLVFEILRLIVQVTVLGEYVYLLIMGNPSPQLKKFGGWVADYTYRVLRYLTFNENERPFPFTRFPGEVEPPEEKVIF